MYWRDHDLVHASEHQLTMYRREHVGFVFQFYNPIPSLTVRENVALVTDLAVNPMTPEEALDLVGLAHRLDHFPSQLSGGEQQRAVAALNRAQAAFKQAKTDHERTKALAEGDVIAPARREHEALTLEFAAKDLLAARFAVDVARHQVEMARAALPRIHKSAKVAAGLDQRWEIRSPVLGRLLRVFQESEGVVALGAPLLELADVTDLEVVVDVLTTDAVQVEPGAVVRFERWGGAAAVAGRVRVVEPGAFTKVSALGVEEQRTNVVVDVVAPPEQWKAVGDGYRVDARIIVFQKDGAIAIPVGALFREGASWMVFVDADGRAQKRAIQVTRRNGVEALVDEGLNPGESVILYPSDAVQDGVRITIRRQERIAAGAPTPGSVED